MTTVSKIEGGWFSKCRFRLSAECIGCKQLGDAAHIRLENLKELHGLTAGGFQHVAFASATHAWDFLNMFHGLKAVRFQDVGSPERRAHSFQN
eukprot:7379310-Pyramimonas_sp.AAC.1